MIGTTGIMKLVFFTVKKSYENFLLGGILLISSVLEILFIAKNGTGNSYYAAAVKSMLQSWHNFFFVSYDPGGFISVDKPPVALWIQTLSAKIFGFHGWALLLPQAMAQILSVWLLYHLVKRTSGSLAGIIAAFTLAVTPISIVMGSTNNVDSILVLFLLIAAYFLYQSLETKKLSHVLLSFLFIGIGFNTKMLQAYIVLPAFLVTYLFCVPISRLNRIRNLTIALYLLLLVSLSWATIVDLTPKQNRPYVGSSQTNSALHLALGYNGIQRLTGNMFGFGDLAQKVRYSFTTKSSKMVTTNLPTNQTIVSNPEGNSGSVFVGAASLSRFFDQDFGGQIGWLIPLASISLLALLLRKKLAFTMVTSEQRATFFWGIWLLSCIGVFSIAGFMHPYYTVTLAPAIAALVGIGTFALWETFHHTSWKMWLLPIALLGTVMGQISILSFYPAFGWLIPYLMGMLLLGIVFLLLTKKRFYVFKITTYIVMLSLLFIPSFIWIGYSMIHSVNQTIPSAGPNNSMEPGGNGGPSNDNQTNGKLISFLISHQGRAKYLVGTASSMEASNIIITTGKAVMTWGGFSGTDQTITLSQLKRDLQKGVIRYFFIQPMNTTMSQLPGVPGRQNNIITQWITQNCTAIPPSEWQVTGGFGPQNQLFSCIIK